MIIVAALLASLFGGAVGRRKALALVADPLAEQQACALVLRTRPVRWGGRVRTRGISELEWFARIAYFQTYGRWPDLRSPWDVERYGAILACTSARGRQG